MLRSYFVDSETQSRRLWTSYRKMSQEIVFIQNRYGFYVVGHVWKITIDRNANMLDWHGKCNDLAVDFMKLYVGDFSFCNNRLAVFLPEHQAGKFSEMIGFETQSHGSSIVQTFYGVGLVQEKPLDFEKYPKPVSYCNGWRFYLGSSIPCMFVYDKTDSASEEPKKKIKIDRDTEMNLVSSQYGMIRNDTFEPPVYAWQGQAAYLSRVLPKEIYSRIPPESISMPYAILGDYLETDLGVDRATAEQVRRYDRDYSERMQSIEAEAELESLQRAAK